MSDPSLSQANSSNNISYSSIETQRELRIEKMLKLKALGHNPYTPYGHRDFTLGFIKFWFDFVHKFSFEEFLEVEGDYAPLEYFLDQVLFPSDLVQKAEDKLAIRQMVQEMGLDPDDSEVMETTDVMYSEFEPELIKEARLLLPAFFELSEDERLDLKHALIPVIEGEVRGVTLKPGQKVVLAGRIKSKRLSGKIGFATIEDESCPEGFQFIFKQDDLPKIDNAEHKLTFEDFKELFDEGDYIEATGYLEYSQRGEKSLFVEGFEILTKALRPLPEKLEYDNFEERYTNRVADFKMDTKDKNGLSVRDMIRLKSRYWQIWREEMLEEGFLEVECPIFEATPGGADAKPFTTFYNELDQEINLRISLELPLKKLIAGGFEKVFEIGRIFRNEGNDPSHLQEYTQIEWYWAYSDYNDAMPLINRIYRKIAQEILGSLEQIDYKGNHINWGPWFDLEKNKPIGWKNVNGWPAIPYFEAVRHFSGGKVDLEGKNYEQMLEIAKENNIEIEASTSIANLIDKIYKKTARIHMIQPMFLILQPVDLEPLAKRDPVQPHLVHRWQVIAGGEELGKCFSELNDPIDQLERFQVQQAARDAGDEEAQFMNTEYVKALEYGLPPLSGFGLSERMLPFLLGKHIRETVTFPHIRTQENVESGKSKKTMVAHAVLLDTPEIPTWSKLNAAAHLSASFAAREGKKLIHIDHTTTLDGKQIPMNIQHAIIVKRADSKQSLVELKEIAKNNGLIVTCFTEEMRDSSNDEKVKEKQEAKTEEQINFLGILVYGEKKQVESLTKNFGLMK